MRTYEGGNSVKQNENSSLLEGVTEASLISFAGSSRERDDRRGRDGKDEMSVFVRAPRHGSETAGRQGVGRMTARRVVEGSRTDKASNRVRFGAPCDSAVGHLSGVWKPKFRTRSGPREGGRMS